MPFTMSRMCTVAVFAPSKETAKSNLYESSASSLIWRGTATVHQKGDLGGPTKLISLNEPPALALSIAAFSLPSKEGAALFEWGRGRVTSWRPFHRKRPRNWRAELGGLGGLGVALRSFSKRLKHSGRRRRRHASKPRRVSASVLHRLLTCEHSRSDCAVFGSFCLTVSPGFAQVLRNITRVLQVCWFWWTARCACKEKCGGATSGRFVSHGLYTSISIHTGESSSQRVSDVVAGLVLVTSIGDHAEDGGCCSGVVDVVVVALTSISVHTGGMQFSVRI